MRVIKRGATPGAALPKKESAGGYDTTTADTNDATKSIALPVYIEGAAFRLASWFTALFRGLA
jgi:hypothetical protein